MTTKMDEVGAVNALLFWVHQQELLPLQKLRIQGVILSVLLLFVKGSSAIYQPQLQLLN